MNPIRIINQFIYKFFVQTHLYWKVNDRPIWYLCLLWPFIKIIWEPFSMKRSHWFTWIKDSPTIKYLKEHFKEYPLLTVPGYEKSKPRRNGWQNFMQSNFQWSRTVVVKPTDSNIEYCVGFIRDYDDKIMYDSIVKKGPSALLLGPEPVDFFAFSYPDRKPVKLKISVVGLSKWQLGKVAVF